MSNFVNLLDIIYPIGSVYITFSDVSPVDAVGGSWGKRLMISFYMLYLRQIKQAVH